MNKGFGGFLGVFLKSPNFFVILVGFLAFDGSFYYKSRSFPKDHGVTFKIQVDFFFVRGAFFGVFLRSI